MSLKLIYGAAGTGKTSACFEMIKKAANSGHKILVLAPQHISLQTERNIAKINGIDKNAEIAVYSFGRLATYVFSRVGPVLANYSDNSVKSMLIKRILLNNIKKLTVLAKSAENDSFAVSMLETINSLKASCITPDNLREVAETSDKMLTKLKLLDIALVYEKYNAEFTDNFYYTDDNLSLLCQKFNDYNLFLDYHVFIDGFNGFSKQQYDVIGELLKNASVVTVTCATDTIENDKTSVFFRGITMAQKLLNIAYDNKIEVEPNTYLETCHKFNNNPELLHLEKNINKYPGEKFPDETKNISLYQATDYYDEALNVAKSIFKLCRDDGLRFKDIAVVCRNFNTYLPVLKKVFSDYEIPVFASEKSDALMHPYIDEILCAFEVMINNFSQKSLIKWIKADFHRFAPQDIYLLENYIVASGSNEKMWSQPLNYNGGLSDEDFSRVKEVAPRLLEGILNFSKLLKGRKTFLSISDALKTLLDEQYILEKYEYLVKEEKLQKASEYITVYNGLIKVINNMNEVFGETKITTEKYLAILRVGLKGLELGQIPAVIDSVTVCEPDLYKEEKKVVFLLGVNAGVLPKGYINDDLLSDSDKLLLEQNGYDAPDNNLIKHKAENYLIYQVLTSPYEKLYVSYSSADFEGNTLEPSRVIGRLNDIFPKLKTIKGAYVKKDTIDNVDAVIPTFTRLVADEFKENTDVLLQWYKTNKPDLYDVVVRSRDYKNCPEKLREDVLKDLYGSTPFYSISKIEQYNKCAFAYFMKYGLSAKPRRENTANVADLGTIMHEVIEKYTLYAKEAGFENITEEQCKELANNLTKEALYNCLGEIYFESRKGKTAEKKITNILNGVLWNITGFYKESSYNLYGCEVDFGINGTFPPIEIQLDNGAVAKLTGKIDRVDLLKTEDKYYVNVVDYKSSDKTIDYAQTLFGVQIQLPVYINAICGFLSEKNKVITVPAAMLYCKIDYSPVEAERNYTDEQIAKKIKNSLKMKGLVIDSVDVNEAMGTTYSVKPDVTKSQIDVMCKNAYKKIKSTINEILAGNTGILPASINGKNSCTYCDYQSVCSFDSLFGNEQRIVGTLSKEEYFDYVGKMDSQSAESN